MMRAFRTFLSKLRLLLPKGKIVAEGDRTLSGSLEKGSSLKQRFSIHRCNLFFLRNPIIEGFKTLELPVMYRIFNIEDLIYQIIN
jgi:hypothetical protein